MNIVVKTREGTVRTVQGEEGRSVMEVLRNNGFDELLALCGGCCACATCHVYVDPAYRAQLSPRSSDEDDLLDSSEYRQEASRLSCQLQVHAGLDGLSVEIAPEE